MLINALLIGLWAGFAGVEKLIFQFHFHRPIVTGLVVGLILGDVTTGLITGATLELVWAGAVALAGAQPPNVVIGGIIGVALAIITKSDPQVSVGLAVPFAVALQAIITLLYTAMSPIMHRFDEYANKADTKGIERLNFLLPVLLFVLYFVIAFSCIYFGSEQAAEVVSSLPQWVINGLSTAGGMMPAVGFAMLLKIMWKTSYIPFFIVGFVLAAYLELDTLAIAALAIAIAAYDYGISNNGDKAKPAPVVEEDFSNGI
ncbi:PTS N-acetylgalactosamine transporter subunit IIC [Breznakia pachnodae]|uniref:PTS system N-acetylgalactosamine-specific IIC component n=1 Tax=Breznakia pachnodae TaxID=265178 RepID=A0ABU0DZV2_9FIRM|nr:PTS N-acetylgalactosamine transporter subunit IIC [Breznakia pachnodae]MDQ0360160.1 PTS system N-acetylgalactosamine-specific IIC component [Breznakia pachnodae]